ncbi:hypothetical protein U1Q18_012115 [Sarracenia purpurea var. burkii]
MEEKDVVDALNLMIGVRPPLSHRKVLVSDIAKIGKDIEKKLRELKEKRDAESGGSSRAIAPPTKRPYIASQGQREKREREREREKEREVEKKSSDREAREEGVA